MAVEFKTIHRNGSAVEPADLQLPDIPDVRNLGTQLVHRTISLTFILLAMGFVGALTAASLIKIDITVEGNGRLEPSTVWAARSQENGILGKVVVASGDTVQQGQVLAVLDSLSVWGSLVQLEAQQQAQRLDYERMQVTSPGVTRELQHRHQQARAHLLRARASLRERLVEYGYGSKVDSVMNTYQPGSHTNIDRALAEVYQAEADVQYAGDPDELNRLNTLDLQMKQTEIQQTAAQIRLFRQRLKRLTITAPITGVVLTEQVHRRAGTLIREGDELLEVAELSSWLVYLFVGERNVHKVRVGDPAKLKLQALQTTNQELFYGRVLSVAAEPTSAEAAPGLAIAGKYRVTVALDSEELDRVTHQRLRRGYTVQGKIITRSGRILELLWNYLQEQVRA